MSQEEQWYRVCQIGSTKVSVLSGDKNPGEIRGVSFCSERKGCAVCFDSIYKAKEFLASLEEIKIGIKKYIKAQDTQQKSISKEKTNEHLQPSTRH